MSATLRILDFAAAEHTLADSVRADAERLLADTLAGGAAGANSAEARKLATAMKGFGPGADARLLSGGNAPAFAAACLWLASDEAFYVTGEALNVSGGEEMH